MEICTVGSVREESVSGAKVDLNGHAAGNGGYSQGKPKAHCVLLYSERFPSTRLTRIWRSSLPQSISSVSTLPTV